ncbi:MAG: hypothetical protein ACQUYJ_13845, partial [Ferruginibacter sp.]
DLIASFIFISAVAFAQSNVSVVQLSKAPKSNLVGHSNFGKIYALPQDNMPCIVPQTATAALMPAVNNTPALVNSAIPNAFPKQDLIAANTTTNNFFKLNKAPKQPSENLMLDLIPKK